MSAASRHADGRHAHPFEVARRGSAAAIHTCGQRGFHRPHM
ncbi:hypothetical protein HMPREF0043_01551 [Actinobaculum sp. oral taxon 183 str. F0552]|nr:hypothetical protein HMPREF0043_01551 [Actinobaculum sp. oral taxon 183 str. F0552]